MILKCTSIFLGIVAAVLCAANVWADDTPPVQVLERKLQQRDMAISELLERVEALEQRLGMQASGRTSGAAKSTAVESATASDAEDGIASPPGRVVATASDAERALERSLTRDGALLLREGVVEIEPSLRFTHNEDRTPTLVTSDGVVFAGETEINADSLTADLAVRVGLPWSSQLEVGIPYQWRRAESVTNVGFAPLDTSTATGAGLGDFRIGFAKTLLREGVWRPDLVGRVTWDTATGESSDGGVSLGGGFHEISGSLSAIKRQDPIAFVGGLSYTYSLEKDDIQPGAALSASFGSYIALSPESSIQLLLSAGYQDETKWSGHDIDGSDRVIGSFVVGGSTLMAKGTLMNLSLGIGLTDDADDFSLSLSLPTRFY
jgi:hypothetical protein